MKSKNYKYILICGALLCNGVSSISVAHANTTDTIERKEETIITKEKQSRKYGKKKKTLIQIFHFYHSKNSNKLISNNLKNFSTFPQSCHQNINLFLRIIKIKTNSYR